MRAATRSLALLLLLGGCVGFGQQRIGIDRSDYANRLRETGKEQLLLNIVSMRYGDAPLFLDVTSVISQYTREGSVRADAGLDAASQNAGAGVGGQYLMRETPTITYAPISGDRFARSMLAPIPPASILAMIEAGWSAGELFNLIVRSINGVSNTALSPMFAHHSDPEFGDLVATIDRLQQTGGLTVHVSRGENGRYTAAARVSRTLSPADRADLNRIVTMLHLPGDSRELPIVFGADQNAPNQLAIGSRSMFEILSEMAQGVEVPPEDRGGRAIQRPEGTHRDQPLVRVHSGTSRPADAHVAVRYRDHWFWIDGADTMSKRMFLITQILLSLNDTSSSTTAPLVTIPTG